MATLRPASTSWRTAARRSLAPSATVALAFAAAIGVGAALLMLPWAHAPGSAPRPLDSIFTAVSAVTVTGLATVDTGSTWSFFGQLVVLLLIQLGGLGMVASATALMLLLVNRLNMSTRLAAASELPAFSLGGIGKRLRFLILLTLVVESVIALILTLVFLFRYGMPLPRAAWHGVFHAVSAFNNAGFSLFPDNLIGFRGDPLVLGAIAVAIVIGGLGLPVFLDLRRDFRRPARWSLHTRLTLAATAVLLLTGTLGYLLFETTSSDLPNELLNDAFASVTARTAGFNSIDYGKVSDESLLLTCFLMIIGGGSASTAGGLKVTTFVILIAVVLAEAGGTRDVNVGDRRLPVTAIRTALAIVFAYTALISIGLLLLLATTDEPLAESLFEVVSAVATVGLSTGITPELGAPALWVLMVLMFAGRLGVLTLASAFALRRRSETYRLPEGQPFIG